MSSYPWAKIQACSFRHELPQPVLQEYRRLPLPSAGRPRPGKWFRLSRQTRWLAHHNRGEIKIFPCCHRPRHGASQIGAFFFVFVHYGGCRGGVLVPSPYPFKNCPPCAPVLKHQFVREAKFYQRPGWWGKGSW